LRRSHSQTHLIELDGVLGPSGELFLDASGNGSYDPGEYFRDLNGNAVWDGGDGFIDVTGIGERPTTI